MNETTLKLWARARRHAPKRVERVEPPPRPVRVKPDPAVKTARDRDRRLRLQASGLCYRCRAVRGDDGTTWMCARCNAKQSGDARARNNSGGAAAAIVPETSAKSAAAPLAPVCDIRPECEIRSGDDGWSGSRAGSAVARNGGVA